MGFQTVLIESKSKLRFSKNYLIIEKEDVTESVYIQNIKLLIINNLEITLSVYLLNQLNKHNICIIICDEKTNPNGIFVPIYGSFNCVKMMTTQISWIQYQKEKTWELVLKSKIQNQIVLLNKLKIHNTLDKYVSKIELADEKNIEGTVSKLYFRCLFGKSFNRKEVSNINDQLNYGYAIILSFINREIISQGYFTQLGIHHYNNTNQFNLSCDLMEPLRPFIDEIVYENKNKILDKEAKLSLINVLYKTYSIDGKKHQLYNAIPIYLKSVFDYLNNQNEIKVITFD